MPIGAGVMATSRVSVYPTTCAFTSFSPTAGNAACGDFITFNVSVSNVDGHTPSSGAFDILDLVSGTVIASGTIAAGTGTAVSTIVNNFINVVVDYHGAANAFGPSRSAATQYLMNKNTVTITITVPAVNDGINSFNHATPLTITAHVVAVNTEHGTKTIPPGKVAFKLFIDGSTFVSLPVGTLDGSGNATIIMPANTVSAGSAHYLQALYAGGGCYTPSSTPSGTDGRVVTPT